LTIEVAGPLRHGDGLQDKGHDIGGGSSARRDFTRRRFCLMLAARPDAVADADHLCLIDGRKMLGSEGKIGQSKFRKH